MSDSAAWCELGDSTIGQRGGATPSHGVSGVAAALEAEPIDGGG